jgi:hypothetical protein
VGGESFSVLILGFGIFLSLIDLSSMIFQLLLNSICCFLDFDECGFLESE